MGLKILDSGTRMFIGENANTPTHESELHQTDLQLSDIKLLGVYMTGSILYFFFLLGFTFTVMCGLEGQCRYPSVLGVHFSNRMGFSRGGGGVW